MNTQLLAQLLPWIVLFGIMYLLLIRPQQVRERKRRDMLGALKKGDKVVTIGGIYGVLAAVKDDTVRLRVGDKVEFTLSREGIASVRGEDQID